MSSAVDAPIRVLIVDDSPDLRLLWRLTLERRGGFAIVGEAPDGREAVRLAEEQSPDVVLLDIAMPVMDGLEALPEIRRLAPTTRIIVLSAYSTSRMRDQAMTAGADAYVEKSSSNEKLLGAIHDLCPGRPRTTAPATPAPAQSAPTDVSPAAPEGDPDLFQRSLFDVLQEGVLFVDREGAVQSANFMATVMLGIPTSRLVGASLGNLGLTLVGDDGSFMPSSGPELITATLATGRPRFGLSFTLLHQGAPVRWLLVSVRPLLRLGEERAESGIVSLLDVTELRRAAAKFRGLLESAPDAIICVDANGRIALANGQADRLFGYAREELVGQPVEMLVPLRARPIHREHRAGYFAAPVTRPMGAGRQLAARRKDGSEFPAEISLSAIETEDGILVSAAVRDVTKRSRSEPSRAAIDVTDAPE